MSGQEFFSFEEVSESVKKWEAKNFVTLYTRSSKSIEAARRAVVWSLVNVVVSEASIVRMRTCGNQY